MYDNMLGKLIKLIVTVPAEWLGTLVDLVEKLCGEEGLKWLTALKRFLRKEDAWVVYKWQVWKKILLGTGLQNADDFRSAIHRSGCEIVKWADVFLKSPTFSAKKVSTVLELVKVRVEELGFAKSTTYSQICDRATELGLNICPCEAVPQLRLQYLYQPSHEWIVVATEPLITSGGYLILSGVSSYSEGKLQLGGVHVHKDYLWDIDAMFVFTRK